METDDGTIYRDFTLYYNGYIIDTNGCFASSRFKNRLNTLEGIVDETIFPKKGSSIYVAPKCPTATEDIRKNYTIKRLPDTGDYNVIYPLGDKYFYKYYLESILICPKYNAIFASSGSLQKSLLMAEARKVYPTLQDSVCIYKKSDSICALDLPDAYIGLLNGNSKKPVVSIKNLSLDTENELNVDILEIVLRAANADFTNENYETLQMQIKVLNQYNWRQYLGTISLLFNEIIGGTKHIKYMRRCKSKNSKPVSEILNVRSDFISEKDKALSQRFINHLMNIGENKFVATETLIYKLEQFDISLATFSKLFDTITRITPIKFNNEEKEN